MGVTVRRKIVDGVLSALEVEQITMSARTEADRERIRHELRTRGVLVRLAECARTEPDRAGAELVAHDAELEHDFDRAELVRLRDGLMLEAKRATEWHAISAQIPLHLYPQYSSLPNNHEAHTTEVVRLHVHASESYYRRLFEHALTPEHVRDTGYSPANDRNLRGWCPPHVWNWPRTTRTNRSLAPERSI